jgi:hypothetical protein
MAPMKKSNANKVVKNLVKKNFFMIPTKIPSSPNKIDYRRVSYVTSIASGTTITGTIISIGSNGVTACSEWPNLAALYTEFRVCCAKLTFIPRFPQSPVYSNTQPGADTPSGTLMIADDRSGGATTPANITGLWAFSNPKVSNWSQNTKYKYVADDFEDDFWNQMVTSAAPQEWRMIIGVTNPGFALITNQVVFDIYVEYGVQFKGNQ